MYNNLVQDTRYQKLSFSLIFRITQFREMNEYCIFLEWTIPFLCIPFESGHDISSLQVIGFYSYIQVFPLILAHDIHLEAILSMVAQKNAYVCSACTIVRQILFFHNYIKKECLRPMNSFPCFAPYKNYFD